PLARSHCPQDGRGDGAHTPCASRDGEADAARSPSRVPDIALGPPTVAVVASPSIRPGVQRSNAASRPGASHDAWSWNAWQLREHARDSPLASARSTRDAPHEPDGLERGPPLDPPGIALADRFSDRPC